MIVRKLGPRTLIDTPAKVNLSLEILGRRADGFHEIETLMVAVSVCDTLEFTPSPDGTITLDCQWAAGLAARDQQLTGELPPVEKNIVWRAVQLVRERTGTKAGATIRLRKRIPTAAGLGGASSNAAAALVAANVGWQLELSKDKLQSLAAELGSDVPFFFSGGAAICRGRGEVIEPVMLPRLHVVIVRPPVGLSTPLVYQTLGYSVGQRTDSPVPSEPLARRLAAGQVAPAARMLNNRLEGPAARLTPWINRLADEFSRLDVLGHQMSGSGSSYFGLCTSSRQARRVAARLRARGVGTVFAATTMTAAT